jgi:hypothetical protein
MTDYLMVFDFHFDGLREVFFVPCGIYEIASAVPQIFCIDNQLLIYFCI